MCQRRKISYAHTIKGINYGILYHKEHIVRNNKSLY